MMPRQQVLLLVTVVGLCLYTGVYFFGPLVDRVDRNAKMVAALTRKVELAGQTSERMDRLNLDAERLQRWHELLDRKVPHGTGNAEMIVILSSLASKHNLRQLHISESRFGQVPPGKQVEGSKLPCNIISWQGSGYYQDIKDFLKALQECDRLLEIGDLSLTKRTEEESVSAPEAMNSDVTELLDETERQLSVSFQIKTYYDPSDPGSDGTGLFPEIPEETQGTANPF